MSIATGQFTIIDYNDALTLTGYVGSNIQKTQMFNPDNGSYNPDWTVLPYLVLTPYIFKLGSSTDLIGASDASITQVTWYSINAGVETAITADSTHTFSGYKNSILTIMANEAADAPGKDYVCKVTYHDATTGLDLTVKVPISFSRVVNGGGIADAVAWCPNGNIFKNDNIVSLTAQCTLWRGSVPDTDKISYKWFVQDATIPAPTTLSAAAASGATSISVTSAAGLIVGQSIKVGTANAVTINGISGTTITLSAGLSSAQSNGATVANTLYEAHAGAGWRNIPSDIAGNITGITAGTGTVTVYNAYVTDVCTLLCLLQDTDSTSNSYLSYFKDSVTFIDQTDPIQIQITSTGGDVFKNGVGSTTLTAKVFQAGAEVDTAGTKYAYTWTVFNKDGNASTFNGGASSKTGKSITVGDADVSVKATFQVTIS